MGWEVVDWIDLAEVEAYGALLWKRELISWFCKMRGISRLAEEMVAFEEGLCSTDLVFRFMFQSANSLLLQPIVIWQNMLRSA